jgi:type IV pilus assembly protein PilA
MSPPLKAPAAGFTLIELMIVIAIVAILAAIAIPAYSDYLIRAQAAEGLVTATGAKVAVWEYVHNTGRFPSTNASAGLPGGTSISGKYISSVSLQPGGIILIAYAKPGTNALLQVNTLSLSPIDKTGSIDWVCKSTLDSRYLPTVCRTG